MLSLNRALRADDLIERARRRTGLDDFGDTPFREGLDVLLRACNEEAGLSLFGRVCTRWDIVRFLSNLLRMQDEERRAPEILDEPIERPIFITGLPRSGTTFLHQLLTGDNATHIPRVWQLIHPYPEKADARSDRRRVRVARQLRMFEFLAPGFRKMHPINADSPQECSEVTAHIFASLRFDSTYSVPGYRSWLDGAGHLDAYRFHKRFLQHLQFQSGGAGCWVSKCPDHIFALQAIREVYPDARFVFMHRDPLRVLVSVARLTEMLRRPFSRHVDRAALGRQECERWAAGTELMIQAADSEPFAETIFHLQYHEFVRDPLNAVRRLYRHFGMTLEPATAGRIGAMVQAQPNGGYGANQHRFDTYHIDPDEARERFAPYMARFGIASETRPSWQARYPDLRSPASASASPGGVAD